VVQKRADVAAEQMMEVVKAGDRGALEALLAKLLSGASETGTGRKEEQKRAQRMQPETVRPTYEFFELLFRLKSRETTVHSGRKDIAATLRPLLYLPGYHHHLSSATWFYPT
jgi:hypothetical protein